jgi:hypothetical protein
MSFISLISILMMTFSLDLTTLPLLKSLGIDKVTVQYNELFYKIDKLI